MPKLLLRGEAIGNVKGVLFDKDGTLSNSEHDLLRLAKLRIKQAILYLEKENATNQELSRVVEMLSISYGINSLGLIPSGCIAIASRDQNLICTANVFSILGESWPTAFRIATDIFHEVDLIKNSLSSKKQERTLLPGALSILKKLHSTDVICSVISNDTRSGIQSFLRMNNLESICSKYWSAEDQPSKPNPTAVKSLCNILGLKPSECALVGDADSDLQMARQAGIGVILGYIAGWSIPPKLEEHQHLIRHWDELSVE